MLSGVTTYLSRLHMAKGCEGTVTRIRDTLFSHIQRLPYAWHNLNQTGDIIQRCTQDVDLIRNFISDQLLELVRVIVLIAVSLALMFSMNVAGADRADLHPDRRRLLADFLRDRRQPVPRCR